MSFTLSHLAFAHAARAGAGVWQRCRNGGGVRIVRTAAGTALRLPGPVRVAVVDLAGPLGDLDCARSASPPYTSAWILALPAGPRGTP